jgi:fermentation-respiration switch protein FrsA (DUF1100 family)
MYLFIFIAAAVFLLLAVSFIAFRQVFKRRGQTDFSDKAQLQLSPLFPFEADISSGIKWINAQNWRELEITSGDGLKLRGRWLPPADKKSKKAALLFHGYHSMPHNDFCLTARWLYDKGYGVFLPSQRAHGLSEGSYICFGAKERRDCRLWVDKILELAGKDAQLVLGGVSMGATTVLLAAGLGLPDNVKAIFADCGFTSPKEILRYFIKKRCSMPVFPLLQLLGLFCRIFCGFWPSSASTVEVMKENKSIPVLFMHGANDITVPVSMTDENYTACAAPKRIFKCENAGHTACSLAGKEQYFLELGSFLKEYIA